MDYPLESFEGNGILFGARKPLLLPFKPEGRTAAVCPFFLQLHRVEPHVEAGMPLNIAATAFPSTMVEPAS